MKKIGHLIQGCDSKLFIVCPTPRMLLENHPNLKEAALKARMEYSNYVKACKLDRDMFISTYLRLLSGHGKELVLLPLPQGTIESCIGIERGDSDWYYHVEYSAFLQLMHRLYMQEAEILMLRLEDMMLHIQNDNADLKSLLLSISHLLRKILEIDE